MITKMSHMSLFVLNQETAYDFYVNKLGFTVHTDLQAGPDFRWLTVTSPTQPDLEISLMPLVDSPMVPVGTAAIMRELVAKGTFGSAIFECDDLDATYADLLAKGVVFKQAPKKEFYGYQAIFLDDSGNWFSLTEKKK